MDFLKKKLMSRLLAMGIRIVKVYEEVIFITKLSLNMFDYAKLCYEVTKTSYLIQEWSYVPLGGSLPNMKQKNLAFGAAASMVHPATGYSIARSLSEAPNYASVIEKILKRDYSKGFLTFKRNNWNMSIEGMQAKVGTHACKVCMHYFWLYDVLYISYSARIFHIENIKHTHVEYIT